MHFVCIKVDRESDRMWMLFTMDAVQAMGVQEAGR